jgi:hypothetical protein
MDISAIATPARWQPHIAVTTMMVLLAGLDLAGSLFAKEWAHRHHSGFFLAGLVSFVVLYVVYARALAVAELSIVSLGWIVFLQVGLLLVDRLVYGVILPPGKWAAVAAILALQAYLMLASDGSAPLSPTADRTQIAVDAPAPPVTPRIPSAQ